MIQGSGGSSGGRLGAADEEELVVVNPTQPLIVSSIQGSGGSSGGRPGAADEEELDEFIISLRTQLEIFVNR
jgi:hypothetical protein